MSNNKYNLVYAHIDYIRRRLKENSDDSYFKDEEIYKCLIDARSLVLTRKYKKGKEIADSLYQTICVPVCEDTFHDCNCVPEGLDCLVLKTKEDVPKAIFNGVQELSRVATLGGEEIAPTTEAKARYRKYKKTRVNSLYYIRVNNRLAIMNSPSNRLKAIKITAIFEDPVSAMAVNLCDTDDCTDIVGTGFSTEMADNQDIYQIVLESLLATKQLPEDLSNNAESTPDQLKY
jgi:hypothetical protein